MQRKAIFRSDHENCMNTLATASRKRFFFLNPECYLVKGHASGALYDLHSGDVYSIPSEFVPVIDACEQGLSLDEIDDQLSNIDSGRMLDYLVLLEKERLGRFYSTHIFVEKLQPPYTLAQRNFLRIPPSLIYAYLELTTECNLRCAFCDSRSGLVRSTTGCWRWELEIQRPLLSHDEWLIILEDLAKVGCKVLHFIGGEPTLRWNTLSELVLLGRRHNMQILLHTNGFVADEMEKVEFLANNQVTFWIQLLAGDERLHDNIAGITGSYQNTITMIQYLRKRGSNFLIQLPLFVANQDQIELTLNLLRGLEPSGIIQDILQPSGDGPSPLLANKWINCLYRTTPSFPKVPADTFFQRHDGHACWNGRTAICAQGKILPCPAAREFVIGDLRESSVSTFYQERKYEQYWYLSKDDIAECSICEFRYACADCVPLNKNALKKKSKYCLYDPIKGSWSDI